MAKPAPDSYRVTGEVRASDGRTSPATPALYQPNMALKFERVPYGDGLVAEVRFIPVDESQGTLPRYFGRSAPFSLSSGVDIMVPVDVQLSDGPQLSSTLDALEIIGASNDTVDSPNIQLRVRARGAQQLEVAQDFQFIQGLARFEAASALETEADAEGISTYVLDYAMNDSLERCSTNLGGDPLLCEGARTVFVRVLNQGLFSPTLETTLTLDTQGPQLVLASVQYELPPDNPVSAPQAASLGTRIVVALSFSERLRADGPLAMVATNGSSRLVFELLERDTNSALFAATVGSSTIADGTYTPAITAQDEISNQTTTTFSAPMLVVDQAAPTLQIEQFRVSFVRSPIGNAAEEPLGTQFTLPAGPAYFALAPIDPLEDIDTLPASVFRADGVAPQLIRVWAEREKQNLLLTARPQADGTWRRETLQLANVDTHSVFVTAFDSAGNESAPELIENAWFVASTAAPSNGESPHGAHADGRLFAPLQADVPNLQRSALGAPDGVSATQIAQRDWQALREEPQTLTGHRMIYDPVRGRTLLLGGLREGATLPDSFPVWSWDGEQWEPLQLSALATPRSSFAITYDSARDRVVIFGGLGDSFNRLRDTWEFDGLAWTRIDTNNAPYFRYGAAMAYDGSRRRTLLFGGRLLGGDRGADTWVYDGASWTELNVSGAVPARSYHTVVYDSTRERMVLFGGAGADGEPLSDTWELVGMQWRRVTTTNTPPARTEHTMVFDPIRGRVVLHGGLSAQDQLLQDTWVFDGTDWSPLPAAGAPPGRANHGMAFDHLRDRAVIFGGDAVANVVSRHQDTWELSGDRWSEINTARTNPPARSEHALAFDSLREQVLLFGGRPLVTISDRLNDTWAFDGARWREINAANPPPPRSEHAMVFDEARGVMVLFGGRVPGDAVLNDTWEFNGISWERILGAAPPARRGHRMAFDRALGQVVLYGGTSDGSAYFSDTWVYDGAWQQRSPASAPPGLLLHAMAYDVLRSRSVLFGGVLQSGGYSDQTWAFDGTTWRNLNATSPPPETYDHAMAYDAERARLVMFGGRDTINRTSNAFSFDGISWAPLATSVAPPPLSTPGLSYDASRERLVMFGGRDMDLAPYGETWLLPSPSIPAAQLSVRLPEDILPSQPQDIRVRAFCEGRHAAGDGARLWGWVTDQPTGGWASLQVSAPNRATPLEYVAPASRFILNGTSRRMFFQCRPDGDNGADFAEVQLDFMEVRLRYSTL